MLEDGPSPAHAAKRSVLSWNVWYECGSWDCWCGLLLLHFICHNVVCVRQKPRLQAVRQYGCRCYHWPRTLRQRWRHDGINPPPCTVHSTRSRTYNAKENAQQNMKIREEKRNRSTVFHVYRRHYEKFGCLITGNQESTPHPTQSVAISKPARKEDDCPPQADTRLTP